jgi:hypothetical protein
VVIAHGVQRRQDAVFLAYKEQFDTLTEADFVDFWCIYLISLAYEQFIRSDKYVQFLETCDDEIATFREKYRAARIPEFDRNKTLRESIGWALAVVKRLKPKVTWKAPDNVGQFELSLDIDTAPARRAHDSDQSFMPAHIEALASSLMSFSHGDPTPSKKRCAASCKRCGFSVLLGFASKYSFVTIFSSISSRPKDLPLFLT